MTTAALKHLLERARALVAALRDIVLAREACPHAATADLIARGGGCSKEMSPEEFARQSAARADWYGLAELRQLYRRFAQAFAQADCAGDGKTISERVRLALRVLANLGERRGQPRKISGKRAGYSRPGREFPRGLPLGRRSDDAVAALVGLGSGPQLRRAVLVLASGDEGLIRAVDAGALTLREAARRARGRV